MRTLTLSFLLPLSLLWVGGGAAPLRAADPIDAAKGGAHAEGGLSVTVATKAPFAGGGRCVGLVFTNATQDERIDLGPWRRRIKGAGLSNSDGKSASLLNSRFVSDSNREIEPPTIFPGKSAQAWLFFDDLKPGKDGGFLLELPGKDAKSIIAFKVPAELAPPK